MRTFALNNQQNTMLMAVAGIKYTKDALGRNRYVRIDLEKYGDIAKDFLDALEALANKSDETITLDEFNEYIDNRLSLNV